jgi:hypothetical protein
VTPLFGVCLSDEWCMTSTLLRNSIMVLCYPHNNNTTLPGCCSSGMYATQTFCVLTEDNALDLCTVTRLETHCTCNSVQAHLLTTSSQFLQDTSQSRSNDRTQERHLHPRYPQKRGPIPEHQVRRHLGVGGAEIPTSGQSATLKSAEASPRSTMLIGVGYRAQSRMSSYEEV